MPNELNDNEIKELTSISEMMNELTTQFQKTREELLKTTLRAQIELLKGRLKRLAISISETKKQLDAFCIPEEVRHLEERLKGRLRYSFSPYTDMDLEREKIDAFAWKSYEQLEEEKKENIQCLEEKSLEPAVADVYCQFENRFKAFIGPIKKESFLH